MNIKKVLIVDDEKPLLLSLREGFEDFRDQFEVLTAENGQEAVDVLRSEPVDLVVTDLRMPKMNGFQLLVEMNKDFPNIPVIIMTAFNTPVIEKQVKELGILTLIEKPIDFEELLKNILIKLTSHENGDGARVTGFSIAGFLQLVNVEKKSCRLEITTPDEKKGSFYFNKGNLFSASYDKLVGDEAAMMMLAIKNVQISMKALPKKEPEKTIESDVLSLIMSSTERNDEVEDVSTENGVSKNEKLENEAEKEGGEQQKEKIEEQAEGENETSIYKQIIGETQMADITEKLKEFGSIDGFLAVGIFTPQGEMAAEFNPSGQKLNELGALANEVLLKSQKATEVMGVGRGNMIHVEAPKAQIVARCLNEATDFAATQAGRAHLHMVLVMEKEGSLAMGKMKLEGAITEIAASFR